MQFDAHLLVPTFQQSRDIVSAIPVKMLLACLCATMLGVAFDLGLERTGGTGSGLMLVYGIAISFLQVWVTREALQISGIEAALPTANSLSVYLQGLLIGFGVIAGLLLFVLPGLYVFARWYLAAVLLVHKGSGRREAMGRSWDLLEAHWPAALGVGLIMFLPTIAPVAIELAAPELAAEYGLAWIVGTNLLAGIGLVGGYVSAVALYLNIEQPASTLQEVFG